MIRTRFYDNVLADHLERHRQMAFVTGPRQVGKTTMCRRLGQGYLDWDNLDDRRTLLKGPSAVAEALGLSTLRPSLPVAVFDELHKYARWRTFLKGFHDTYGDRVRILVTGSSRLDVYRRGGDSLMGRYFPYRMHPFSVAEVGRQDLPEGPIRPPATVDESEFSALWTHGGYPEPFLKRDERFTRRWRDLRNRQLMKEDLRDLTRIQELDQIEVLAALLAERSGQQLVYSHLASEVRVSVDTVRRWIATLSSLHLGFRVRPWFRNVPKALRKEPRWFLRDWSGIGDPGSRLETMVACHLLKAVEGWEDLGLGKFELRYLRDKAKREVDFVVVREGKPWFLVEVKKSDTRLSPSLEYFQRETKAPHAFQAALDMDPVDPDCFARKDPVVVPVRTLLSQLL
jgi:predicted AAA+ superfamily ATPase